MVGNPDTSSRLRLADIEALLQNIADPEIPVLSIGDLGILRSVQWAADAAGAELLEVVITPTYSACPAIEQIAQDIIGLLNVHGIAGKVRLQLAPAWSSDWLSAPARERLRAWGIAPPAQSMPQTVRFVRAARAPSGDTVQHPASQGIAVPCPRCQSLDTTQTSYFGSTSCKALYRCRNCLEPFDYFKPY